MKALCFVLLLSSCQTVQLPPEPLKDYTLARTALQAAKNIDAARYAPGPWHKSEKYYRRAERMYRNKDYDKAKTYFRLSRRYAEKAENIARVARYKQGEDIP